MLRIGVDARPLNFPYSGIGHYLGALLELLIPATQDEVRWHLYSDRAIPEPMSWHDSVLRCGTNQSRLMSTVFAQRHFGGWAKCDQLNLFWSPRHQLPLTLSGKIPTVVTLHDLVFMTHPDTMTRAGRTLEKMLTPRSLAKATAVITTSQSVLGQLREHSASLAAKASAIALSSNIEYAADIKTATGAETAAGAESATVAAAQATTAPATAYFLFCGSTEPRKNLDRLLRAFAQLKSSPAAPVQNLVIVTGGGWNNTGTRELIERYSAFVEVRHNVTEAEKAVLLRNADFLVLPSLTEGFGIPLVEAQKLGRPALTSNTGAMPEVGGDAALYVDPYDEQSIAGGLLKLCNDVELRERLSRNATAQARNFSWQRAADETLEVLKRAANSG